jgi:hypothetical protein
MPAAQGKVYQTVSPVGAGTNLDKEGPRPPKFCDISFLSDRRIQRVEGEKLMNTSAKIGLSAAAVAVVGGIAVAGTSWADRGFGHHGMRMGMMGGLGHELLQNVDANADGALSQEEIDAAVNTRFGEFDLDSDDRFSLDEFKALWAQITEPAAVRAFQFLDPNGDAAVARQELDDRFGTAVSRFDRNDDGLLSPDDRPQHRGRWHRGDRQEE